MRRLAGWILLALVASFVGFAPSAHAASGLSIGPFLQEVDLAKGQASSSFLVTIGNGTSATLPMTISIVDFGAADDKGAVNFLPPDSLEDKFGLADWMSTETNHIVLQPKSSQRVKVTIDNRDTLGPGGHYGAIIFRLDNSQNTGIASQVDLSKAVSTLVLVKKEDGAKESLQFNDLTWDGAPFNLPSGINVKLYNNGNVHSIPNGDITVTDTLGHVVDKDQFNTANTYILPDSSRIYPMPLSHSPAQFFPGWTTITFRFRVNDSSPYQTIVRRIYIFPVAFIITLVILIIVLINGIIFRKRIAKLIHRFKTRHGNAIERHEDDQKPHRRKHKKS